MTRFVRGVVKYCTDLVMIAGAAAVAMGCGMIYLPAGLIAGGVLAIAGAVLSGMGGGDG